MDKIIENLLNNVNKVEKYASVTEYIKNNNEKLKVNLTTASAIKKLRPLEIEYFIKSHENGAACILFERLLGLRPSKSWGMLKEDLVGSLQYWLQAIIKQMLNNTDIWWNFLKLILNFIEVIYAKDASIPDTLVVLTSDSLLHLATREDFDAQQRHKILYCLCIYSSASGRKVRYHLRNKFNEYLTKLACQLTSCGYLPLQFSALEILLRWLVPRGELSVRAEAAARWFPPVRCPATAREIFINASWLNFFKDARAFLNALNDANGLVTSVACKRFFVGDTRIISGEETQQPWLDINSGERSISVLIDPRVLSSVGVQLRGCETLVIEGSQASRATLHSETSEITLSVEMARAPVVLPAALPVGTGTGTGSVTVTLVISTRTDLGRLTSALGTVFGEKYQVLINIEAGLPLSPIREIAKHQNSSSEESRFSQPYEVKRRRQGEFGVGQNYLTLRNRFGSKSRASLSSASTTSLAQLHNKLAALPQRRFPEKYRNSPPQPQLSSVTEITETDDLHSLESRNTVRFNPFDIGLAGSRKIKAESDSELLKQKPKTNTSCLLVTVLGSDESVINDTTELLSKSKDYQNQNIVDLIFQEDAEADFKRAKLKDSGITSDGKKNQDNTENSEAIENTPIENHRDLTNKSRITKKKPCTIYASKSTTEDESNTEAILEPPVYVNLRRSRVKRPQSNLTAYESERAEQSFNAQHVEGFFSQHIVRSNTGSIEIGPALGRKINESTSNTSANVKESLNVNYDLNLEVEQFEIDVIECLNEMVEKVGVDLIRCDKESRVQKSNRADAFVNNQSNMMIKTKTTIKKTKPVTKPKKNIESTSSVTKKKNPKSVASKSKNQRIEKKASKKMSTIIERNDEELQEIRSPKHKVKSAIVTKINKTVINKEDEISPATEYSILKRKRKLYSPKDDETKLSDSENDDISLEALKKMSCRNETPKSSASCYKEIEKERKRHLRQSRSRKSRCNFEKSPSPTTLVNDAIFDKLKSTVENKEKFTVIETKSTDDVYNFSSGSEDSDFQMKRIELRKRLKSKTVITSESSMSAKLGKQRTRRNYSRKTYSDELIKTKQARKKKTKKTNIKNKVDILMEPVIELDDERMRAAPEEQLNTSIVNAKPSAKQPIMIDFVIDEPQMELIADDQESAPKLETKRQKSIKNTKLALPGKDKGSKAASDNDDSGTLSPLPGLIVEAVSKRKDYNDLSIVAMGRKIHQICKEGPGVTNETCDTQNMLFSDIERCISPLNFSDNITHEIDLIEKENLAPRVERHVSKKATKILKEMKDEKISQNKKKNISKDEVIEIPETFDVRSERSISTDSINAYVSSDKRPPSLAALDKSVPPRDTVDMEEPMIHYYVTLERALRDSRSTSRQPREKPKDDKRLELEKSSRVSSASPYKLSFDIRKMVPLRRTSDSSSPTSNSIIQETSKSIQVQQKNTKYTTTKQSQCKVTSKYPVVDSPKEKVPVVSLVPLSIEEIDRWSMPKSLNAKDRSETTVSSRNEANSPKFVYNTRKKLKSFKTKFVDLTSASEDECKTNAKTKDHFTCKEDTRNLAKITKDDTKSISRSSTASKWRKLSTISPVNMDCIILKQKDSEQILTVRKVPNQTMKPKAANVQTEVLPSPVASSIEIQMSSREYSTKLSQRNSSSTRNEPPIRPTKRKFSSPLLHLGESRRNYPKMDITESGPSVSSVNDWWQRNDISKQNNNGLAKVNDILNDVREKIDTSLVEINQNTNKKIVEYLMEVQNLLSYHQKEQKKVYKNASDAARTSAAVVAAATAATKDLDAAVTAMKRLEEKTIETVEQLKKNTANLLRQHFDQNNLVVNILKGDVQAALDHVQRLESERS